MIDGIAGTNRSVLTAKGLPRETDAWFNSRLIELDANCPVSSRAVGAAGKRNISCDKKLLSRQVEISLASLCLGNGSHEGPRYAQVQGQVVGNAPVVLHKRTKHLPASARGGS